MSNTYYVVREDTRQLLDILPNYQSHYDYNIHCRLGYAIINNCAIGVISLINHKSRAEKYKGLGV